VNARVLLLLSALSVIAGALRADEPTRCVQEELRRRNLYFGDIDGRITPELTTALRRYQSRKNLAVTGQIDQETASSLNIPVPASPANAVREWPELPVLKSDAARELPPSEQVALEAKVDVDSEMSPVPPPPPADSPTNAQNLTPERVTKLVEDYLRDAETNNVEAQLRYYATRVKYFDHGEVSRDFIRRDTSNYVKRWTSRKYMLTAPVRFVAGSKPDETEVQFSIAFTVKNEKHTVTGQTRNYWTIRPEAGDELKIIAIREERLRS
jgi:hypothetical protein